MKNYLYLLSALVFSLLVASCSKDSDDPVPTPDPEPDTVASIYTVSATGATYTFDTTTSTFTLTMPTVTDFSQVNLYFTTSGGKVYLNDKEVTSGSNQTDLSNPITLKIVNGTASASYTVKARNTGLPVVSITTPNSQSITSKEDWMEGATIKINKVDGTVDYEGSMSIRGRGNSTWNYPKKPYALKLEKKGSLLDMPKHKRWVLLANWKDRTLLRNDAAFWLSKHSGLPYTVRGEFVELVLNGKHQGNYYLCEQIKIDENRVNVTEMDANETDPEKVTGGFLLELDTYYDEVNKFTSSKFNLPYQFKQPDETELSSAAQEYLMNYVEDLETLLKDNTRVQNHEYEAYFDVDTAIDYMLVEELTNNTDFYSTWPWNGPHSVYFYKDRGGKLCSGPVWDFDYHAFVPDYSYYWAGATRTLYYPALLKDEKFRSRMIERWEQQRDTFYKLNEYIDEMAEKLAVSDEVNIKMWPIDNSENGDEKMSFSSAIARMKEGFQKKWNWMNTNIYTLSM